MKIWQAIVVGLVGFVVAGCHSDPNVAYLERDNNQKEMEIYRLKNRVADLEDQLNSMTAAPAVITGPGPAMTRPGSSAAPAPLFTPEGAHTEPAGPNLEPLNISPGVESAPGQIPNTLRAPGGESGRRSAPPSGLPGGSSQWQPHAEGDESGRPSSVRLASGISETDNRPVWQITLHPSLTGGIGSGSVGDEGLLVVVEPRDQAGNILVAAGATSVALIDPALQGEKARLGRWDFSSSQTERMLHTGSEPGIHLRLPWRFAPQHDRLEVFVRYTTRDGRTLEARRQIAVAVGDSSPPPREPRPGAEPVRPDDRPQRPQWSPER